MQKPLKLLQASTAAQFFLMKYAWRCDLSILYNEAASIKVFSTCVCYFKSHWELAKMKIEYEYIQYKNYKSPSYL